MLICSELFKAQDTIRVNGWKFESREERKNRVFEERQLFISNYVQKLNSLVIEDYKNCELPDFFTNKYFDEINCSKFSAGTHHGHFSLRKKIIDQLTNYNVLWCVMESDDERIHYKVDRKSKRKSLYGKIVFEHFSTYELVELRLDELENDRLLSKK